MTRYRSSRASDGVVAVQVAMVLSFWVVAPASAQVDPTDCARRFSGPHVIGTFLEAGSVVPADIDGDGDPDALARGRAPFENVITWYENLDGRGRFGPVHVVTSDFAAVSIHAADVDGDGVNDSCDSCPGSQVGATLVIGGCDTGVAEHVSDDGCTLADGLEVCAFESRTHGDFMRCVTGVAGDWKKSGVITGREFGRIVSCAATIRPSNQRDCSGPRRTYPPVKP